MTRRKPEFQTLDPSTWPTVAWTDFDTTARESICTRTTAIEQYARGVAIKEIEQTTGVDRRQIYRLLERALAMHPDGRIYGFRALIAHTRVAEYVRMSPVKLNGERGSRGAVGAMSQLGMVWVRGAEHLDHARQGRVETGAHVQWIDRQPDLVDTDHRSHSRSQAAHWVASDTGQLTVID